MDVATAEAATALIASVPTAPAKIAPRSNHHQEHIKDWLLELDQC